MANKEILDVEKSAQYATEKGEEAHQFSSHNVGEKADITETSIRQPTASFSPPQEKLGEEGIERIQTHRSRAISTKPNALKQITKTITARSNASVVDPGPPPEGGVKAWLQVFAGMLVITNTWGMTATFGVFQSYYTTELGMEPSAVSWIGSMQMLGHFGLGMFTGRALDAGFFHWVVVPGMLLSALGIFLTSLCHTYWQFFLAQGLMNGIGNGCQFAPSMSLVTTYFARNRSAALAVMACGSAIGGLLYPTIARQLLPQLGFQWTVRVMGFIMLAVGAVYTSLLRPRLPPRKSGPLFELSAFREAPYTLYAIGLFLVCLGVYFAFYYISAYAVNVIGVSYGTSINLILILNGMGLPGRLIPGYIANRWLGPYNTLIPLTFITSLLMYCWAAVKTKASLYAFTILYGFFSAGFQGLFPAVMANLTKDMSKVGTRNGMGLSVVGWASLCGPPIAGALIQRSGGDYLAAQVWAGTMMLVGSCTILAGRVCITGWRIRERV